MQKTEGKVLPLGVSVIGNAVNFSVIVPQPKACELILYRKDGQTEPLTFAMENPIGSIRTIGITGIIPQEYEYNYLVNGETFTDPCAAELTGREKWGMARLQEMREVRAAAAPQPYDWEGDRPLQLPADEVVAYSLHVRGFTRHNASHVKQKGTFAGVIQKLPYLTDLGVNQLHLMPVYDFEENLTYCNYWGYGDGYFYAPKAAYAAQGTGVRELKDLVKSCHRAGIEVILNFPFSDQISPQAIIWDLIHFVMDYHVDGFILNPAAAPMDAILRDPVLGAVKILHKDDRFQNTMRGFLKGDEGTVPDVMYQIRRHSQSEGTYNFITDHTGFTLMDLVSYDSKHNLANGENNQDGPDYNYSWNCGAEGPTRKKAVLQLRAHQQRNAMFLLLLAQGTPCLLAGDEFGNSQKGNNNVYCQDNAISWVNWQALGRSSDLHDFVRDLIRLRREHPVLHSRLPLLGIDQTSCGIPDISFHGENAWQAPAEVPSRVLGVYLSGEAAHDEDCFIAFNMHWLKHKFALPGDPKDKKWHMIASTADGVLSEPMLLADQRQIEVAERTIVVLIRHESHRS